MGGGKGMFKGNVLSLSRSSDSLMLNVIGLLYRVTVPVFLHYSRLRLRLVPLNQQKKMSNKFFSIL